MTVSSRTPEGTPCDCRVCGHHINIGPVSTSGDALCPNCGSLLWLGKCETGNARTRIVEIMRGIEKLSKEPVDSAVMLNGFSQGIVHAMGAKAAVVWDLKGHQIKNRYTYPDNAPELRIAQHSWHESILYQHLVAHKHDSSSGDTREVHDADTDTDRLLLLCSFTCPAIADGVVEVFQRHDTPVAARPGFISFLSQAVRLLEKSVALTTAA